MTPRVFYKIATKVKKSQQQLVKIGLVAIAIFLFAALANALFFDVMYAAILTPLGFVFFLCGLGLLPSWYKDKEEQKESNFQAFWRANGIISRLFLWYSAVFLTIWLLGVSLITLFSVAHTLLYIVNN